jgi:uncharacterized protein YpmB
MGQIRNVIIIIIITVILSIVTLGLAYVFDLYLNPFIIITTTYFQLLDIETFFSHNLIYLLLLLLLLL